MIIFRSLHISELVDPREVTYSNFLGYAARINNERARTALIKNKARQIIKEFAPTNPAYYEKLRELRLGVGVLSRVCQD